MFKNKHFTFENFLGAYILLICLCATLTLIELTLSVHVICFLAFCSPAFLVLYSPIFSFPVCMFTITTGSVNWVNGH